MANLEVNFCGVSIKNPIVASSAEPTLNARNMKKCAGAKCRVPSAFTAEAASHWKSLRSSSKK
jgi:hypothetical protein